MEALIVSLQSVWNDSGFEGVGQYPQDRFL